MWPTPCCTAQQVVSDITVIRSWSTCSLHFEFHNTIFYYPCSLMYFQRLFCFKYQTQLALQHGGMYLNLVTSLHLIYSLDLKQNVVSTVVHMTECNCGIKYTTAYRENTVKCIHGHWEVQIQTSTNAVASLPQQRTSSTESPSLCFQSCQHQTHHCSQHSTVYYLVIL